MVSISYKLKISSALRWAWQRCAVVILCVVCALFFMTFGCDKQSTNRLDTLDDVGKQNMFTLELKEATSREVFKMFAEQNHCIIGEEYAHAINTFGMYVSNTSKFLNAFEISDLFRESDLFKWVKPFFYSINPPWYSCYDDVKITIKELKGETAYVRKSCFARRSDWEEKYIFELEKEHSKYFFGNTIVPIEDIPEKYRKEGLKVKINGNVINCWAPFHVAIFHM